MMKNDTYAEILTPGNIWLSLKVGGGLGDWDVGRGTWNSGTWGLGDRGAWGHRDVRMRGCRDLGTWDVSTCRDSRTRDIGTGGHD